MSDFEDRLSSALRTAGNDAPEATGLAPAARRRAGVRRRRTALTAVAAVVAVGGVVGGVALLGGRDAGPSGTPVAGDGTPTVTDSSTPSTTQTRVESWRDLSVTVPAEWGHAFLNDWCGGGGDLGEPVVERPGISIDILCNPVNGYGVRFYDGALADLVGDPGKAWQYDPGDGDPQYPEGSWLGYQRARDNVVLVVGPNRATSDQVLGSFVHNQSADPNGCPAHWEDGPAVAEGDLRLCRYDLDGWLEQSELLTGDDASAAVTALEAAPAKGDRICTMQASGPTVQVTSADATGLITLDACQGFSWDGTDHDLTADVLYWVLSPGWTGGTEGDVPMPKSFRQ